MSNELVTEVLSLLAQLEAPGVDDPSRNRLEGLLEKKYESLVIDILANEHDRLFSEREVKEAFFDRGLEVGATQIWTTLERLAGEKHIRKKGLRYGSIHPDVLDRQLAETTPPPTTRLKS